LLFLILLIIAIENTKINKILNILIQVFKNLRINKICEINKEQDLLNNLTNNNNTIIKDFIYCVFLNLNNILKFILKNNLYLLRIYFCF